MRKLGFILIHMIFMIYGFDDHLKTERWSLSFPNNTQSKDGIHAEICVTENATLLNFTLPEAAFVESVQINPSNGTFQVSHIVYSFDSVAWFTAKNTDNSLISVDIFTKHFSIVVEWVRGCYEISLTGCLNHKVPDVTLSSTTPTLKDFIHISLVSHQQGIIHTFSYNGKNIISDIVQEVISDRHVLQVYSIKKESLTDCPTSCNETLCSYSLVARSRYIGENAFTKNSIAVFKNVTDEMEIKGLENANVSHVSDDSHCIIVSWNYPKCPFNFTTISLKVTSTKDGTTEFGIAEHNATEKLMCKLKPYMEYSARIELNNGGNIIQASDPLSIRTAVGVPSPPRNLQPQVLNHSISWTEPVETNGPIEYNVTIKGYQPYNTLFTYYLHITTAQTNLTFHNLPLATLYNITVIAFNKRYSSKPLSKLIPSRFVVQQSVSTPVLCEVTPATVVLKLNAVTGSINGRLKAYQIIVSKPTHFPILLKSNEILSFKNKNVYILKELEPFNDSILTTIGDDSTKNFSLKPNTEYVILVRILVTFLNRTLPGPLSLPLDIKTESFHQLTITQTVIYKERISVRILNKNTNVSFYELIVSDKRFPQSSFSTHKLMAFSYFIIKHKVNEEMIHIYPEQSKSFTDSYQTYFVYVRFGRTGNIPAYSMPQFVLQNNITKLTVQVSISISNIQTDSLLLHINARNFNSGILTIIGVKLEKTNDFNTSLYSVKAIDYNTDIKFDVPFVIAEFNDDEVKEDITIKFGGRNEKRKRRSVDVQFNYFLDPDAFYVMYAMHKENNVTTFVLNSQVKAVQLAHKAPATLSKGAKAGIIAGSVLIVIIGFFLWIFYKVYRYRHETHSESTTGHNKKADTFGKSNPSYELDAESGYYSRPKEDFHLNYPVHQKYPPIQKSQFGRYVAKMKAGDEFSKQYQLLDEIILSDCAVAKHVQHRHKNRCEDYPPSDRTRFKLKPDRQDMFTDYINASYVSSHRTKHAYIATQAPLPATISDFWLMTWQSDARSIVMLCKRIENGEAKAVIYWPNQQQEEKYGKIVVKNEGQEKFPNKGYSVTTFQIQRKPETCRQIKLFHFTDWPDSNIPRNNDNLRTLQQNLHAWNTVDKPIIVQCSDGVGRTGSFIAVDAIINHLNKSNTIDVFNLVNYLRSCRPLSVETESQFVFIHDYITEHLLLHEPGFSAEPSEVLVTTDNIDKVFDTLKKTDTNGEDGFQCHFKALNRDMDLSSSVGGNIIHANKNRNPELVPLDENRVQLLVAGLTLHETYINATHVNEFLISTQTPLECTCPDFWLMVYNCHIRAIIMLNELSEGDHKYPKYFPNGNVKQITFDSIQVELKQESVLCDKLIKRSFLLRCSTDDEVISIEHYQIKGVSKTFHNVSPRAAEIVLNSIRHNDGEKVLVHCDDGFGRTGAMLAGIMAVHEIEATGECDMDLLINRLLSRNPNYLMQKGQYRFVYVLLHEYFMTKRLTTKL